MLSSTSASISPSPLSSHPISAQNLTLASIDAARREAARHGICVQLVAAIFAEDRGVSHEGVGATAAGVVGGGVGDGGGGGDDGGGGDGGDGGGGGGGEGCELLPAEEAVITGSLGEGLPGHAHRAKLPLLPRILHAGHAHGTGAFLIYSNIDIALQREAYVQLAALLRWAPDVPISAIREEFERAGDGFTLADAYARRGKGLPHPGHDLWAFPRAWVPDLTLGDVALGVSLVATALNQALLTRAQVVMPPPPTWPTICFHHLSLSSRLSARLSSRRSSHLLSSPLLSCSAS